MVSLSPKGGYVLHCHSQTMQAQAPSSSTASVSLPVIRGLQAPPLVLLRAPGVSDPSGAWGTAGTGQEAGIRNPVFRYCGGNPQRRRRPHRCPPPRDGASPAGGQGVDRRVDGVSTGVWAGWRAPAGRTPGPACFWSPQGQCRHSFRRAIRYLGEKAPALGCGPVPSYFSFSFPSNECDVMIRRDLSEGSCSPF